MKDLVKHFLKLWALPWLITSPFIILGWPIWAYTLIFGVFHILLRVSDGKKSEKQETVQEYMTRELAGQIGEEAANSETIQLLISLNVMQTEECEKALHKAYLNLFPR